MKVIIKIRNFFNEKYAQNFKSLKEYTIKVLIYTLTNAVLTVVCVFITNYLTFDSLILTIAARAVVCVILPNAALFVLFHKTKEFKSLVATLIHLTKGKIKILQKFA